MPVRIWPRIKLNPDFKTWKVQEHESGATYTAYILAGIQIELTSRYKDDNMCYVHIGACVSVYFNERYTSEEKAIKGIINWLEGYIKENFEPIVLPDRLPVLGDCLATDGWNDCINYMYNVNPNLIVEEV